MLNDDQDAGARTRASRTTTRARRTSPSARRPRRSASACLLTRGRLHLRLAPQPRRDPGQVPLGHRQAGRRAAPADHGDATSAATPCGSWRRSRHGTVEGPGRRLLLYGAAGRDLRPGDRLQPRAWAAPCTPSSRPSASCRTTPSSAARRTSPSARRCSRGSTGSPASSIANIGDASSAAARSGKGMHVRGHGPVPDALGTDVPGRPADPLQLHEQLLRHGRPDRGRDHGLRACSRASARASTPSRCTPSAWTATIRWPSPTPSSARRRSSRRAGARCCWTSSPTGYSRPLALGCLVLPHARRRWTLWQEVDCHQELRRQILAAQGRQPRRRWTPSQAGRAASRSQVIELAVSPERPRRVSPAPRDRPSAS